MSKVWLITGASRGLGRAFTKRFSKPDTAPLPRPEIRSNSSLLKKTNPSLSSCHLEENKIDYLQCARSSVG